MKLVNDVQFRSASLHCCVALISFAAHHLKSMFLGVVAPPSGTFDGKVFLRRVSETKKYAKLTHNQNFDDRAETNAKLRNGEWYICGA